MSVLGQIPLVTAYVLFQEKVQEYFQEKAQATIQPFWREHAPQVTTLIVEAASQVAVLT